MSALVIYLCAIFCQTIFGVNSSFTSFALFLSLCKVKSCRSCLFQLESLQKPCRLWQQLQIPQDRKPKSRKKSMTSWMMTSLLVSMVYHVLCWSFGQYFILFAKSWTGAASFEGWLETRSGTVDLVQDDTCHCDSEPVSCDLILWKTF